MICSECFHCDTKLYCCVSVCAYKLVMLQLNDVTLYVCDCLRHTCEFTRLIRKEYGYGEDTVSLDQFVLAYG